MANDKVSMPQSGGGLIRYFDEYKSKIVIDKKWILVAIGVLVVVEILLQRGL
ncbi:preprotein translocase subunit Sec61beta [archaeon]|jgi:preprotein translocase subunit Sec61beta|nr:preprotein translocase subunit Sec61beta [archaeon]MBT3731134.1 preprotein translocase subunit Sec61beta [archaeon]MBT4669711.1 preprotein translocase subunit Sec61beta [archaeon]MBT5030464.1 preprotein translocase subunit Sec61beta [archaeon]MBT5287439.1 preprotein translocase subunit Sec61beta [archaeon]